MPSKICPDCGRRVTTGGIVPRFCAWGCGSLENEPIAEWISLEHEFERIRNHIPRKIKQIQDELQEPELKIGRRGQTLLFGTGFIKCE